MKFISFITRLTLLTLTMFFTVHGMAQVKANFTSDVSSGCSPLLVNFKNQSTGTNANTEYYWDLGNGSTPSREKDPSALFLNTTGTGSVTYTIKLVIKSTDGADSVTKKSYITVYANPKVSFNTNITQGCPPLNVKFTDVTKAGSGTIKSWLWDFGEGQLSNVQNPSTTYLTSNTYVVSLSVVNSYGCKQTAQSDNPIHVLDTVKAGFNYQYTNICQSPAPVNFQNTSQSTTGISSYSWDFGDGQMATDSSPVHTYLNTGTYSVKLVSKNTGGCADTSVQKITIGKVGANFTYTTGCTKSAMQFTDSSSSIPVSSVWSFGDGTISNSISPTHIYTLPGNYTVTLTADFGTCKGSITKTITVVDKPTASFSPSASGVCQLPYPVTFTNNSTGAATYQWMFGDNKTSTDVNATHTYLQGGFYDVTLIAKASNGCSDTYVMKGAVKVGPPVIDSLLNLNINGCVPQAIAPVASITSAEPIVKYIWNFGDSTTSTDEKPKHVYTKAGSYFVSLIAITAGGCSDTFTISKPVVVGTVPHAAFGADPLNVCARVPVNFTDSSKGTMTNWLWKFGDGAESNKENISHHYMDTGWFTVQLIVSNGGCHDTLTKDKYVYIRPPVANYQSAFNCSKPYERVFNDHSIDAKTWNWDFGDGTTSTDPNPVHTFSQTGIFMVKLKVTNDQCNDSLMVKLQVVQEHPSFTYDPISKPACRNDVITFTATNVTPSNINSYNWIYGDSTSSGFLGNAIISTHKYATIGTFTPQLITKDVMGCMDTVIGKVSTTIYGPVAAFANNPGLCINSIATFKDSSKTDGIHALQKWDWTYEPNVTQSYKSATAYTHQYTKEGYYDVKLVVRDSYGCVDSIIKQKAIQVTNPKAIFSVSNAQKCTKGTITFTNQSVGEGLNYKWNFGDNTNSTSTSSTLAHTYYNEGMYSVSLSVTDKFQCKSDTVQVNAITVSNPKAVISINGPTSTTCPPLLVAPTSQSLHSTAISWSFGDGSISKVDSPSHNYVMGGNYDLTLVAKGFGECYDTAHQLIKLKGPSGKLTYNPLLHCNPSAVSFNCDTKDAVKVTWDFNDGVVQSDNGTHNASHVYKNNGQYLPKLLLTDADGCFVALENTDTLYVSGAKANYVATSQPACDSSLAVFLETSVPYYDTIQSYHWNFGDGSSSTQRNPEHIYSVSGNYQAKLSVITKGGCTDSIVQPVNVVVHKTPSIAISAIDSVCAQSSVTFKGKDTLNETGSTWQWKIGTDTANGNQAIHNFTAGGSYPINLFVTTPFGCADTATHVLNVVDLPKVSAGLDTFVCDGSTVLLKATGADKYNWASSNTLSCTGCATPIAAPNTNSNYSVTGFNNFGCKAIDSVAVEVVKKLYVNANNNDTLCMGESAKLEVTGAEAYSWSPALFLNDAHSANPVFTGVKDTTMHYVVTGTDKKQCFTDSKTITVKVYPVPHIEISQKEVDLNVGFTYPIAMASSPDVTQWRWEPQAFLSDAHAPTPVASPRQTITYTCVASNDGSCFARDQITIHVMCNGANMFIPNTFSPNGDGVNDKFFPRGTGLFNIKSLKIFNRWGQIVYEKDNFLPNVESDGWDGTFKGQPLESDVYVYMLEVICDNNAVLPFKGNVTLLR